MIRGRMDILKNLVALSRIHLQLALGEKWEEWEAIAREKEGLYGRLIAFKGVSIHPAEKELIDIIRKVEEQTERELIRHRDETKKTLAEIERIAGGIKTYRTSYHQKSSKRHFSLNI